MFKSIFEQKPTTISILAVTLFALNTHQALAFSNNRYLAYGKKVQITQTVKPQVLGSYTVSDAYIASMVTDTVNKMVAQGLIKGEKGDKGDPASFPTMDSVDPNSSDLRQAYIPAAVSAANQETFFAASNLSGDNITTNSVNTGDLDSTGSFTNEGSATFSGTANFNASTTMGDLVVSSIESSVSTANFDGYAWNVASSRGLKENFATTSPAEILSKIDNLPIYAWNYKNESPDIVHMGPVAEDFYSTFGLGNSSSSISTIDPAGIALVGIQGLDAKLSSLLDISWILDGFKKLGLDIEQGFVKVEGLVADMIQTKQLEVGSADQPTGITIYDTVTKQPICIFSANNVLQSQPGKCQGIIAASQNSAPATPAQTTQNNDASGTVESVPLITAIPSASSTATSTVDTTLPTQANSIPKATGTPDILPPPDINASSATNNLTTNN